MKKGCDAERYREQVCCSGSMRFVGALQFAHCGQLSYLFETCPGAWFARGKCGGAMEHGVMIEASTKSVRRNLRSQDNVAR